MCIRDRSQTFFKVIFPLMKPTVATVVISDVFWIWNEFQIALILLNTQKLQTLQLAINSMFGAYSTKWDIALPGLITVSYTHLDVYKRQPDG